MEKTPPVVADFEDTGREYTSAKGCRRPLSWREKEKYPLLETPEGIEVCQHMVLIQ